ncbi:hypothetical protein K1719_044942 [Acacia pycnantha]|nr:hypothetical protein K1719_044942 [Acacia pycnantha]
MPPLKQNARLLSKKKKQNARRGRVAQLPYPRPVRWIQAPPPLPAPETPALNEWQPGPPPGFANPLPPPPPENPLPPPPPEHPLPPPPPKNPLPLPPPEHPLPPQPPDNPFPSPPPANPAPVPDLDTTTTITLSDSYSSIHFALASDSSSLEDTATSAPPRISRQGGISGAPVPPGRG